MAWHLAPRSRFYHKIFLLPLLIDLVTLWFKEHAPMILFPTSATHISTSMKLCLYGSCPIDWWQYQSLIGGLQYLRLSWPDILDLTNMLAQFVHVFTQMHISFLLLNLSFDISKPPSTLDFFLKDINYIIFTPFLMKIS